MPLSAPGSTLQLLTRVEREHALGQSELDHKSRPLGPKYSQPAASYPHVYRAHDAGNTLSSSGKKYKLPLGSQTIDQKVLV